jgi:hypothetical protein
MSQFAALVYSMYTVTKLLHILPDFLSLLHLVFHLFHCRKVLNYMDRIVIKSGLEPVLLF